MKEKDVDLMCEGRDLDSGYEGESIDHSLLRTVV